MKNFYLKTVTFLLVLMSISFSSCAVSNVKITRQSFKLSSIIKPGESLAIMPFESQDALSNLGGLLSDEVTANLIENVPGIKIIPTSVTRSFLLNSNTAISGIPDLHSIHSLKEGLKCRYLLTGNFYSSIGDVQYTSSFSNRIASGSVTVRLIDCDSATVVWAKHIENSFQTTAYYLSTDKFKTIYYTDGQLIEQLIKRLGEDIAEYFYPVKQS